MALPGLPGQYTGSAYTKAVAQNFIPDLWIDTVRVVRNSKLVALRCTFALPMAGKVGDRFNIPTIGDVPVQDKLPETPVALSITPPGLYQVEVTHDKVTAFGVENIVDVQSKYNVMNIYSSRHGYAMARWVDNEVLGMRAALYNIAAQNVFVSSTGALAGNGTRFDLPGLLTAKTLLDNLDVPDNRMLLCSFNQHNAMISQQLFASRDYVGMQPVMTGTVGRILDTPVIPTSQIKDNSLTAFRNGSNGLPEPGSGITGSRFLPLQDTFTGLPLVFGGNSAVVNTALYCNTEWLCAFLQWSPGASHSWENLMQLDAVVYRQTYGMKIYRIDHGINIHTSNAL